MQKFLKRTGSDQFLVGDGTWTSDVRLAQAFDKIEAARMVCEKHSLHHVELFYCFGDQRTPYDFAFPLRDSESRWADAQPT